MNRFEHSDVAWNRAPAHLRDHHILDCTDGCAKIFEDDVTEQQHRRQHAPVREVFKRECAEAASENESCEDRSE